MATDRGHTQGDYPRVCDVCGHRFMFNDLKPIGELRFACYECYRPGDLTANQISKFNSRVRPIIVRPRKWAKDYIQTPIYQFPEAAIFNFIAEVAPAGEREGSNDALAAAWAAIYMADIIIQEKRPAIWEATARDVLERCVTYLLTQQTEGDRAWGGGLVYPEVPIVPGALVDTSTSWAAGVAFVKAYEITGSNDYLFAADRLAGFIRRAQCSDLMVLTPTFYPGTTGPYHLGGLTKTITIDDDGTCSRDHLIRDVGALWFLQLLQAVRGDTAIYPTEDTSGMTTDPAASLATMIEELTAFAVTGAAVSGESDPVSGLDVDELRFMYQADQGGGTAAWDVAASGLPVRDFAQALVGLHFAETAPDTITEVMATLAASPAGDADEEYDATLCPATVLTETSPYPSESELYDWASLGLLSPILSAADLATFKTSKDALSTARRYNSTDVTAKFVGVDGLSTFTPLAITPATSGTYDTSVVRAARAGLAYREDPGRYPALRGN